MDVFKLLSRSSKSAANVTSEKLPSAGAATNPQLFGHSEAETLPGDPKKTRKRKRGRDVAETSDVLPIDLDFFADGSKKAKKRIEEDTKGATHETAGHDGTSEAEEDGAKENELETYNEAECKKVLQSHKLKITVLEDFGAGEQPQPEKKRKKPKKDKDEGRGKPKREKKQLFPLPLTSFAQLRSRYGISRRLADNLKEQSYNVPTEVQLGALPLLLREKKEIDVRRDSAGNISSGGEYGGDIDLLTIAPTGSGKTIAFLIPIINALSSEKSSGIDEGPRAVIIAPTRELASQIVNEARKLSRGTGIKATLVKKGVEVVERSEDEGSEDDPDMLQDDGADEDSGSDPGEQGKLVPHKKRRRRRAQRVRAAILVSTPLALLNALKRSDETTTQLPSVRHLVLDEADVLLDPLFREQTLSIWNVCTNRLLRVGLWSATMGSNIEALAIETLNSRWASLPTKNPLPVRQPLIRLVVGLKDTAIPNISHQLTYAATEQGKLLGLRQLLHPTAAPSSEGNPSLRPPFLVFTQTIPRAIALHSELLYDIPPEAGGSSRIAVLHADLSTSARENIMTRFRRGEVWVLITTDLLARGVDFRGLNGVVNYDVPNSAAAYVHRVGRTGRAGRVGGVAVTFYTKEDIPYVKLIANVIHASEKLRGKGEDEASVKQWLLDALPTPTKREKQQLKKRGVEARRSGKDNGAKAKMRISTKSGYERKVENRRKGAKKGSKAREERERRQMIEASESEFEGFE